MAASISENFCFFELALRNESLESDRHGIIKAVGLIIAEVREKFFRLTDISVA